MKVITKYGEEIKTTKDLLLARGVRDLEAFLKPSREEIQNPCFLKDIERGAKLLKKHIDNDGKILIIADSDCDGSCSFAIVYSYIKRINNYQYIDWWIHSEKQHGLEDMIDRIVEEGQLYDLIILPDASTNDYVYHKILIERGVDILVLDHHNISDGDLILEEAVIINNQLSPDYSNKDLTGSGVTYQFCKFFDDYYEYNYAEDFIDLAMLGIVGDMGSLLQPENRAFVYYGLRNIKNRFFQELLNEQAYSIGEEITPIKIAFYVVPLINGMIRFGGQDEKERLYEAFINPLKLIPSKKRGEKGTMTELYQEAIREARNAKKRQDVRKKEITENFEKKIIEKNLLENEVLFIRLEPEDNFPRVLNGLVAMELSKKYSKPTIVARETDGEISGSGRGLDDSNLESFQDFLISSGYFTYAQGHDNAFGCCIESEKLKSFHEYANIYLKEILEKEKIEEVDFISSISSPFLRELVFDVAKNSELWGRGNEEPNFYIKNILLSKTDIKKLGTNQKTYKFEKNNLEFITFKGPDVIDLETLPEYFSINVIGRASINTWGGYQKPQIFIEKVEIEKTELGF